jgi:hypothetical protein
MVVAHVTADQLAEMWLVQRDDMVQDLAPIGSHPALCDAALPGSLHARPFGLQPC